MPSERHFRPVVPIQSFAVFRKDQAKRMPRFPIAQQHIVPLTSNMRTGLVLREAAAHATTHLHETLQADKQNKP